MNESQVLRDGRGKMVSLVCLCLLYKQQCWIAAVAMNWHWYLCLCSTSAGNSRRTILGARLNLQDVMWLSTIRRTQKALQLGWRLGKTNKLAMMTKNWTTVLKSTKWQETQVVMFWFKEELEKSACLCWQDSARCTWAVRTASRSSSSSQVMLMWARCSAFVMNHMLVMLCLYLCDGNQTTFY